MQIFRLVFFMLLLGAGLSFALYALTGQLRYRVYGLRTLKWTISAALGFFAVLILQRIF